MSEDSKEKKKFKYTVYLPEGQDGEERIADAGEIKAVDEQDAKQNISAAYFEGSEIGEREPITIVIEEVK